MRSRAVTRPASLAVSWLIACVVVTGCAGQPPPTPATSGAAASPTTTVSVAATSQTSVPTPVPTLIATLAPTLVAQVTPTAVSQVIATMTTQGTGAAAGQATAAPTAPLTPTALASATVAASPTTGAISAVTPSTVATSPAAPVSTASAGPSAVSTATAVTPSPAGQAVRAIAATGTPTVVGTPATDPTAVAIQTAIMKNNLGQVAAFASGDSTAMKGTATDAFYNQMVQGNQDLANAGATAVQLIQLVWGPIAVSGTTAQATTYETWLTTYKNGQTELQENDQNVYDLVELNGQWLIQADDHPSDQGPQASIGGPARRRPTPTPATTPAPTVPPSVDLSRNWAGYSATGGKFTRVTGTWQVPHVDASTGGTTLSTDATWVGIGGTTSRDLIQAGSEADVVGPGDTTYDTWIEMLPAAATVVPLAVIPGDSLTVTIVEAQPGTWSIELTNNTSGKKYQATVQYKSSYSSAEWVEEAPSTGRRVVPLDNFGVVHFSNDSAVRDGKTVNLAEAGARPITMAGPNAQPLAVPSAIGEDGSSFSVKRA